MKRGRPSKRQEIQSNILQILGEKQVPMTIAALAKLTSKNTGATISWNTIQKYIRELVETNKIEPLKLPHSKIKSEDGLTVYILKRKHV